MDRVHPVHLLRYLHRRNIQVHDHRLLIAPDEDALQWLGRRRVAA